jgi:hypothetical protein
MGFNSAFKGLIERKLLVYTVRINKIKGTVHPCTGTEALYRPYGP